MNGLILLIVFILIFINIVRAILKGSQNREEGTGEKGAQEEGLLLNFLSARARNEAWMEAAGKLDLQYVRPANLRARPALRGIRILPAWNPDGEIGLLDPESGQFTVRSWKQILNVG